MLLTEAVDSSEQLVGEAGESPGGLTVGEDTLLEVGHSKYVMNNG